MLKLKDGVTPRNLFIAAAAANVASDMGITVVITAGTDGKHMTGSRHYTNDALDFRSSNMTLPQRGVFMAKMKDKLGPHYQVILEQDHIHIEFDR